MGADNVAHQVRHLLVVVGAADRHRLSIHDPEHFHRELSVTQETMFQLEPWVITHGSGAGFCWHSNGFNGWCTIRDGTAYQGSSTRSFSSGRNRMYFGINLSRVTSEAAH